MTGRWRRSPTPVASPLRLARHGTFVPITIGSNQFDWVFVSGKWLDLCTVIPAKSLPRTGSGNGIQGVSLCPSLRWRDDDGTSYHPSSAVHTLTGVRFLHILRPLKTSPSLAEWSPQEPWSDPKPVTRALAIPEAAPARHGWPRPPGKSVAGTRAAAGPGRARRRERDASNSRQRPPDPMGQRG